MRKAFFILIMLSFQISFSQIKEIDEDEIIDELLLSEDFALQNMLDLLYNYKALYASINFTNKTYFAGRELKKLSGEVVDQYSLTPQLYYISSKGLMLGFSGLYLSELDPKWDTSVFTIGYGKNVGKNLNIRYETTYNRYVYGKDYENISKNSVDVRLLVFAKNRKVGTEIEVSYLFGEQSAFTTSLSLLGNFKIIEFTKYQKISFQPQFSVYLGQENLELYRIKYNQYRPYIEYYNEKVFDLFYSQLNLPLILSLNELDVDLGYNINFPHKLGSETNIKNTSFYNISVKYAFDL